jgi:hypothetical protein
MKKLFFSLVIIVVLFFSCTKKENIIESITTKENFNVSINYKDTLSEYGCDSIGNIIMINSLRVKLYIIFNPHFVNPDKILSDLQVTDTSGKIASTTSWGCRYITNDSLVYYREYSNLNYFKYGNKYYIHRIIFYHEDSIYFFNDVIDSIIY